MRSVWGSTSLGDTLTPGRLAPGSCVGGTVTDVPLPPLWPVFTEVPPGRVTSVFGTVVLGATSSHPGRPGERP